MSMFTAHSNNSDTDTEYLTTQLVDLTAISLRVLRGTEDPVLHQAIQWAGQGAVPEIASAIQFQRE
jgi:hypothetical protein